MTHIRILIVITLMLSLFGCSVYKAATQPGPAGQVVEQFQSNLIAVMKDGKQLGYAGRYNKLSKPVSDSHDLPKIARIIVGEEWEKLNETQQQKLVDAYTRLTIASYAHNFKDYSGESFVFDSEEKTTRGGFAVHSHLVFPITTFEKTIKFDYMLKEKGNSWRIINVIANGVSDLALKRALYKNIIQREGLDALISKFNENSYESYQPSISTAPISSTPQRIAPPPIPIKPLSLEGFKAQCKELGFKKGTQDYGNCVLELNEAK